MSDDIDRDPDAPFYRDPDAPFDPDANEDMIDSAEADRLAVEREAEEAEKDDTMGDTAPVENLE